MEDQEAAALAAAASEEVVVAVAASAADIEADIITIITTDIFTHPSSFGEDLITDMATEAVALEAS